MLTKQAGLTLLCFPDTVFYKLKVWGTPALSTSISKYHFPKSTGSPCVSVSLSGNSHNIWNFSLITAFVMVTCDY